MFSYFDKLSRKSKYKATLEASLSNLNQVMVSPGEKTAIVAVLACLSDHEYDVYSCSGIGLTALLWYPGENLRPDKTC